MSVYIAASLLFAPISGKHAALRASMLRRATSPFGASKLRDATSCHTCSPATAPKPPAAAASSLSPVPSGVGQFQLQTTMFLPPPVAAVVVVTSFKAGSWREIVVGDCHFELFQRGQQFRILPTVRFSLGSQRKAIDPPQNERNSRNGKNWLLKFCRDQFCVCSYVGFPSKITASPLCAAPPA